MALVCAVLALLTASACSTYVPPAADEPAATLKLRYAYGQRVDDTRLHVSLRVQEGPEAQPLTAFAAYAGPVVEGYPAPEVPEYSLRVRAVPDTVLVSALTFAWSTEVRVPTWTFYHWGTAPHSLNWSVFEPRSRNLELERGCASAVRFDPAPGAVYVVVYRRPRVSGACTVRVFRERTDAKGTPLLEPVASGVTPP